MGLSMDDLHMPTVPSGPSSALQASRTGDSEKTLLELMTERDGLESEMTALGEVLVSQGVDMTTPLLTRDGFPRDDLDIAQIRTTRARIIRLRNDYKVLMSMIEKGLHAHHAAMAKNPDQVPQGASFGGNVAGAAASAATLEPPFAKVNSVVLGSPADVAGLQAGDEVRRFGHINWTNHERLTQVAQVVQNNVNREVVVKVKRLRGDQQADEVQLKLIPKRNWGGRGLLGCHMLPA